MFLLEISARSLIYYFIRSYSGAVPNENNMGQTDIHTPKFIVESDATIVAPLIFATSSVGKNVERRE